MRPSASHTAPQSGSGLFHRWSEFSLFAVAGGRYQKIQREKRSVSPFCKVTVIGGFLPFHKNQRGGHFSPPGGKSGVSFSSALTAAAILAGQGGDIYEFQEDHHARRKPVCVRTSPETQQLVKEMCPLDSCRLLFKLAVELDMVMNALAAGMEIPDEQLRTLRSRCIQDVKNRRQYLAG